MTDFLVRHTIWDHEREESVELYQCVLSADDQMQVRESAEVRAEEVFRRFNDETPVPFHGDHRQVLVTVRYLDDWLSAMRLAGSHLLKMEADE